MRKSLLLVAAISVIGFLAGCSEDTSAPLAPSDDGAAATSLMSLPDAKSLRSDASPPEPGCTPTSGYWKNHSYCGTASARDMTWDYLLDAEDTPFFLSGYTMCEVMWVSPEGNAYYVLAPAFVAAKLNQLAGAGFSEAMEAFDAAVDLFEEYTPEQIALMSGNSMVRRKFILLAETLAAYNNGDIGPGHCDDVM